MRYVKGIWVVARCAYDVLTMCLPVGIDGLIVRLRIGHFGSKEKQ